jgi:TolB-like protein
VNYEFNKKEIEKIEYASGRTEVITEKKAAEVSVSPVNSKNRVAVMPMIYIGDGNDDRSEEMRFQLQDIVISYLSKYAAELKLADATEINAMLLKNGINDDNIRQYTPKELAAILHVEYVIMGSVLQDNGSLVTITNNHTTHRQTIEQRGRRDNEIRIISRNNRNGSYVTKQNIQTNVSLSIYNETGEKIYSRSRQSIWTEPDAYKNALHYLLKRTPLYKR